MGYATPIVSTSFPRNFTRRVYASIADVSLSNSSSQTTIIATGANCIGQPVISPGYLAAGSGILLQAKGILSALASPGTLQFTTKLWGDTTSYQLGQTAAFTPQNTPTNQWWRLWFEMICRTTGATGTLQWHGEFTYYDGVNVYPYVLPLTATGPTTVDTTAGYTLDLMAKWATASASNALKCQSSTIDLFN